MKKLFILLFFFFLLTDLAGCKVQDGNEYSTSQILENVETFTQSEITTTSIFEQTLLTLEELSSTLNNSIEETTTIALTQTLPSAAKKSESKRVIAIDAGHQAKGNNEKEPIGPGASESKAKVASGTQGTATKVPEYQLTLEVSLKLRDALEDKGYAVFMIRESHDVNISNRQRAVLAAEANADILVRIHADGADTSSAKGMSTLCPSSKNPYIPHLYAQSKALSQYILSAMAKATNAKNRGVSEVDNMSGINWSSIPVTIIEMGFMTNPEEDRLMQTADYQEKLVSGMVTGIEEYFANQ
ncbi:hypothetical protein FACS189418_2430 [Clostridia bacterium]|nr:hypothetical protein FACS189418_2430 [Clostridia bacterium]